MGPHAVTADYHAIPQVFFCDPPARVVGLTAPKQNAAGSASAYRRRPGLKVIRAYLYADGYTGRAHMVVDEDHGHIPGVTFVGPGVEELLDSPEWRQPDRLASVAGLRERAPGQAASSTPGGR